MSRMSCVLSIIANGAINIGSLTIMDHPNARLGSIELGDTITVQLSEAERQASDERTMAQSLEIIRRRVTVPELRDSCRKPLGPAEAAERVRAGTLTLVDVRPPEERATASVAAGDASANTQRSTRPTSSNCTTMRAPCPAMVLAAPAAARPQSCWPGCGRRPGAMPVRPIPAITPSPR